MARTRVRTTIGHRGTRTQNGVTVQEIAWNQYTGTITDETGSKLDHPLSLVEASYDLLPYNGTSVSGLGPASDRHYLDWSIDGRVFVANGGAHLALPTPQSIVSLTTKILSRSNPSRAQMSIPNFVYELKDLPGMIHDVMALKQGITKGLKQPHKFAANHYLAATFGWDPLIRDIRKMFDFKNDVDRRVNELERLYAKGGLKRRISNLDDCGAEAGDVNQVITSNFAGTTRGNRGAVTRRKTWGTVRWLPTTLPSYVTDESKRKLANRLVFGLNAQPAHIWNALPWSWLIDWFSNTGDFINSFSCVVPAVSSHVCIMRETATKKYSHRTDSVQGLTGGYGTYELRTRERFLGVLSISAEFPFLTGKQLSILGALAIQRASR